MSSFLLVSPPKRNKSSSLMSSSSSIHIADEIIAHTIFLRLPVKSLLRFKCVCKNWLNIVSSDSFVRMQVAHATEIADPAAVGCCSKDHRLQIYSYNTVFDMDDGDINEYNRTYSGPLNNPPRVTCPFSPNLLFNIIDSPNGLLLCHSGELRKGEGTFHLWNPSTGDFIVLPQDTPLECPGGGEFVPLVNYGFIYDSANDNYKVLNMVYFYKYTDDIEEEEGHFIPISEVRVYSLRSNSWRKFQIDARFLPTCFRSVPPVSNGRTFVNGALHWIMIVSESPEAKIISFNVEKEEYREIQTPNSIDMSLSETSTFCPCLEVLKGSLCIFHSNVAQHYVEVWSMKEHGSKDSWIKLFTITEPMSECNSMFPPYRIPYLQPLKCSDNGEIMIMLRPRALMIYDPKKDSARFVYGSMRNMDLFALNTHIETLENPLRVRRDGRGQSYV